MIDNSTGEEPFRSQILPDRGQSVAVVAFSRRSLLGDFVANDVIFCLVPQESTQWKSNLRRFYEHQMDQCRSFGGILTSKVKLGGDASAAAGPVGRNASAETDAAMKAEILSYSRAKGAFAGVSLEGSTLRPDNDANKDLYGKKIEAKEIVLEPPSASTLISTLDKASPVNKSKS